MAAPTVARTASPTATVVADANISKIDKGNDRFKGFLAGTASGVTKCLVGHPFGKSIVTMLIHDTNHS